MVWLLGVGAACAHGTSRSYLSVDPAGTDGQRSARWEVALLDLAVVLPLDADGDHRIVWGEVLAQEAVIQSMVRADLKVSDSAGNCATELAPLMIDWHGEQAYVVAPLRLGCRGDAGTLAVDYSFLQGIDSSHRMLVRMNDASGVRTLVATPGERREIGAAHASASAEFVRYLKEGAYHIWIGYDHLAFLFALLLPAVLRRSRQGWQPVEQLRDAAMETLKIVSAFTLSHSITLGLSALGWVRPPAPAIEVAIALSVAAAAALNLLPGLKLRGATLAFGFGFIHGFGFANALADLGLSRGDVVLPLLGFNLGVEIGQLAVVAAVLPLLFWWRVRPFYAARWLPAASVGIVAVALYWTAIRWPT
jgi:hypothetical protein